MVLLDLLTFGLWSKLGRLTHYAFDAVLISAVLAGMKRSTGLTVKAEKFGDDKDGYAAYVRKYLSIGEWVLDQSTAIASSTGWFERTR
ncbi:hypothetical protein QBC42DRAFT_295164 [Cladorrhinum samala]|uniref:DUF1748-domain-containing protein n=1 Tax=Cladorrhinum samala TaxID=585594 RepID=A0AAV9HUF1_9PEZI|nr:hypothetical protein QBC42DRAFT_295164 [Cladorrhinum samala]